MIFSGLAKRVERRIKDKGMEDRFNKIQAGFNKIVANVYFEKTGNEKIPGTSRGHIWQCVDAVEEVIALENLAEWLRKNWNDMRISYLRWIISLPLPNNAILALKGEIKIQGERVRTHFITGPGLRERTILNPGDLKNAVIAIKDDPTRDITPADTEEMINIYER